MSNDNANKRYIWIVRHGERIDNIDAKWRNNAPRGAWDDPCLSTRGHQQAQEVGRELAKEDATIDHVFSSPFLRCIQTTANILKVLSESSKYKNKCGTTFKEVDKSKVNSITEILKVRIEPGICESLHVCQRPPGYQDIKDLRPHYPIIDETYKEILTKERLPIETTNKCCFPRVRSTLKQIINNYPGNILIVSHGSPITACHAHLTREFHYVGQCSISKYSAKNPNDIIKNDDENENSNSENLLSELEECCFQCEYVDNFSHLSDHTNLRGLTQCSKEDKLMMMNHIHE